MIIDKLDNDALWPTWNNLKRKKTHDRNPNNLLSVDKGEQI